MSCLRRFLHLEVDLIILCKLKPNDLVHKFASFIDLGRKSDD